MAAHRTTGCPRRRALLSHGKTGSLSERDFLRRSQRTWGWGTPHGGSGQPSSARAPVRHVKKGTSMLFCTVHATISFAPQHTENDTTTCDPHRPALHLRDTSSWRTGTGSLRGRRRRIHLHRPQAAPTQLDSLYSLSTLALTLLVPSGKSMRAVAHAFRKDVDTVTKKQCAGKKLIDRAWSGLTWRSPKKREIY